MTVRLEQRAVVRAVSALEAAATDLDVAARTKAGRVFHRHGLTSIQSQLNAAAASSLAAHDALDGAGHQLAGYTDELAARVGTAAASARAGNRQAARGADVLDAAAGLRDVASRLRTSGSVLEDDDRVLQLHQYRSLHGTPPAQLLDAASEDLRYVGWLGAAEESMRGRAPTQVPFDDIALLARNAHARLSAAAPAINEQLPALAPAVATTLDRLDTQVGNIEAAADFASGHRGVRALDQAGHYPHLSDLARVRRDVDTYRAVLDQLDVPAEATV